jgi:hypothetical protein
MANRGVVDKELPMSKAVLLKKVLVLQLQGSFVFDARN